MFGSALIVFRESLEAAIFVGIIAAATRGLAGRARWLTGGVAAGALGAIALALAADQVGAWADGIGQDLVNVAILSTALAMLLWHCVWVSTHGREMAADARRLADSVQHGSRPPWALMIAVALAVLREGAETVLFIAGYVTGAGQTGAGGVLLGGALGLAGGAAVGTILYAGLARVPTHKLFAVTNVLIGFLAAAIASQLARALAQAGLVERWTTPVWDSSSLISGDSALGAALHALFGYDARPSGLQLVSYLAALTVIVVGTRLITARVAPARPSRSTPVAH
jgi:high-affinity iron transporter